MLRHGDESTWDDSSNSVVVLEDESDNENELDMEGEVDGFRDEFEKLNNLDVTVNLAYNGNEFLKEVMDNVAYPTHDRFVESTHDIQKCEHESDDKEGNNVEELVVPSYQEAINKVVVDTTTVVVNEPQEKTEGPFVSPSTPAVEDLKNRNTYFKSFATDQEVNVTAGCDNGYSSGTIPKDGTHVFESSFSWLDYVGSSKHNVLET
ncbi:hypothetical protein L1987_87846 [Smallanthus sonchifolius]|nr:hypothetical protein L1987_87846 [Smallanthus sonchifolius]